MKKFIFPCILHRSKIKIDISRFIFGGILKIGKLAETINRMLSERYEAFKPSQHINTTKINGYKKMGLIPEVKKMKKKAYYDFKESHLNLILLAYEKIIFQGMRTREAFNEARKEIEFPSLFN